MLRATLVACYLASVTTSKVVPIATFDNAAGTTWDWETVNDPVMGGRSKSSFTTDSERKLGVWDGEVAIVPFLHSPGFCNLQAPGLNKRAAFPDISATDGLTVRMRETNRTGLTQFNLMLMTKGAHHMLQQGVYTASVNLTLTAGSAMEEHFVAWSSFTCTWRGQKVTWCPSIKQELSKITNIGLGTYFPGTAGKFHVEIESIAGTEAPSSAMLPAVRANSPIDLARFDGSDKHHWRVENDPVMGGRSSSSWKQNKDQGIGEYQGECRIVPALSAPGFTIALTDSPILAPAFPDVSSMDGLSLGVRNAGGNITNYKIAFCDSKINFYRCQFQSFKADFEITPSSDFQEVFVPWAKFSDKWSSSTGKHTAEDPPTAKSLQSITQLQIWTEGVAGSFHLQIKHIQASKASATMPVNFV